MQIPLSAVRKTAAPCICPLSGRQARCSLTYSLVVDVRVDIFVHLFQRRAPLAFGSEPASALLFLRAAVLAHDLRDVTIHAASLSITALASGGWGITGVTAVHLMCNDLHQIAQYRLSSSNPVGREMRCIFRLRRPDHGEESAGNSRIPMAVARKPEGTLAEPTNRTLQTPHHRFQLLSKHAGVYHHDAQVVGTAQSAQLTGGRPHGQTPVSTTCCVARIAPSPKLTACA